MTPAQRRLKRTIKQRIDRVIPGIGRVVLRTGARDRKEHQARLRLFDRLVEAGQLEVVQMLVDGTVTWAELRQAERKKRLHSDALAADIAITRPLWDTETTSGAFTAMLPRMGRTESARTRYHVAFAQLHTFAAHQLPATGMVKDLRTVAWPDVFAAMGELSPASRNRVRSSLSAFLTVFLGDKYHPFRRAVMKAMGPMEDERTAPREVTLEEFWTLMGAVDEALIPSYLTLAASGMRVGEYLQCTEESIRRLPRIQIPGGKTGRGETSVAEALVPYVRQAIPCRIGPVPAIWRGVQHDARYKRLWKGMAMASKATGIPCSPHYLRHLYAQIASEELPSVLVQQGLRQKSSRVTDQYTKRRTTDQVASVVGAALIPKGRKKGQQQKVWGKVRGTRSRRAS